VVLAPALLARSAWPRRLAAAVPGALLLLAALLWSSSTQLALAHAHNLIAVVLWVVLSAAQHPPSAGGRLAQALTVGPFLLGGLAISFGAIDGGTGPALGPSLRRHLGALAPGLDPVLGTRVVVLFAYAQAVHYGLWLRVVPEVGRRRPAPRSWAASVKALQHDLGQPLLAGFVLLTVGVALWGLVDLVEARSGYLRLALFHGPLELAVLALVAAEGRKALQ